MTHDAGPLPMPVAARAGRARWLDLRLVVGLVLVLGSVALGARAVAAADDTYRVWALTRDLGASSTLQDGDLVARSVRLEGSAGRYLAADGSKPTGWVLTRAVGGGELLPRAALVRAGSADLRDVSLRVDRLTVAGLRRGSVVDVYAVAASRSAATPTTPPRLVLSGVTVGNDVGDDGGRFGAGSTDVAVVLRVATQDVAAVLGAAGQGQVDLVRVRR